MRGGGRGNFIGGGNEGARRGLCVGCGCICVDVGGWVGEDVSMFGISLNIRLPSALVIVGTSIVGYSGDI